jgi:guanylate kinase
MEGNKVIIISGTGASGKSTFIDLCNQITHNVVELSTVDYVKIKAYELVGWHGEKDEISRRLLSDLKDTLARYNNSPNKYVDNYISLLNNRIVFINSREQPDIDYFKEKYDATTILLTNDRVNHITSNHADAEVYDYIYDYIIVNNGTLNNLKDSAKTFLKEIKLLE